MTPYRAFTIAWMFPAAALAQADSSGRGEVFGTVYDSVARAPVVGAAVQLVSATSPAQGAYSATTDARGQFTVSGVSPGRYVIGFQHEALDSLALTSPLRALDVRAGERAQVDLAVPSPERIVASLCHSTPADSTGLVIGMLRDARTARPLDSGSVLARWSETIIDAAGIHRHERLTQSLVSVEGWFALCRVPAIPDAALFGASGGDSTGAVFVAVPANGLLRRDLYLGGTMTVRGVVRSERNQPIANARIGFIGRDRTVGTDSAGAYFMGDAPAGSQTLEARALGYAPEQRSVILVAGSDTTIAVALTSIKRVMDTIRIVAQRLYNRDSFGFLRRQRQGGGYFFDEAYVNSRRPFDLFQILQQVPGVRISRQGVDREVLVRGSHGDLCSPTLYLNGMRMPKDVLADLDLFAKPEELAGMEVYRSTSTPAQFSNFDGCGSVVVWTRPPRKRR